ncbi:MAG: ATP-binding cassette domain-containing protein, partial [Candidatus Humimicrobiaceae bacterium]
KKIYELNPGEMQIVEISKAVSAKPQLLILDESTAALENTQVKCLFNYLKILVEKGAGIIFTSHRLWEVMEICDDVVIFRNGKSIASIDFAKDSKDPEEIISLITGEVEKVRVEKNRNKVTDEIVLSIERLNYGELLKDISFKLKKGEILGIGGLAGQGQRELMLALAGNYAGLRCDAELNGKKIKLTKPSNAIRNGIMFVPGDKQLEGLLMKQSVFNNIIFPKLGLRNQPIFIPRKKYREECKIAVNLLSIKTQNIDVSVDTLSGGNQQKVVVGKFISFDANIWLLADPAKGIDVEAKIGLYQYIINQVREKKIGVILYASDNEELIEYCDRLMIMYEGQIATILEGDNIKEDAIVAASLRIR